MSILLEISNALQNGRTREVETKILEALEQGISAQDIMDNGLLRGMGELGVRFKRNEVFVPEVLIASRALNRGTALLKPRLVDEGAKSIGKVVLATVKGDLHDIGKNLVSIMLQGAGFEVIDLGTNVGEEAIVEAVKTHAPQILALSALLTTTMEQQGYVIHALKAAGLRDSLKIMVGGAPISQKFCDLIGADAYASDAAGCAEVAKLFIVG